MEAKTLGEWIRQKYTKPGPPDVGFGRSMLMPIPLWLANKLKKMRGVIKMAKKKRPDVATGQFLVLLKPGCGGPASLDARHRTTEEKAIKTAGELISRGKSPVVVEIGRVVDLDE